MYSDKLYKEIRDLNFEVVVQVSFSLSLYLSLSLDPHALLPISLPFYEGC